MRPPVAKDHDLARLAAGARELQPRAEVVDRDDLPAQGDHATDPRDLGGDRPRLGEADDLLHGSDREGVFLRAEAEHDDLL
jgi:hypothetical protein